MVKLMREAVMVDYIAKIKPINADKIETQAHRIATFSENGNSLHIHVEMFDMPVILNIENISMDFQMGTKLMFRR